MTTTHVEEPELPDGITPGELDEEARRDLRGLQKDTADVVAKHLVAAGMLVDEDPERALEHARYARRRASRIAVVREAAGIVAYHAGEWNEALGELRAARRMGGGPGHLAVMADIERALGRPERALELVRAPEAKELGRAETIELAIVAAGARRDLGELDAAVVGLQIPELEPTRRDPWSPRLFYAYADNLLAAGRESDALQWFVHTVNADVEGETDASERIAVLTGEPVEDDGVTFQGEDLLEPETDDADSDPDVDDVGPEDENTSAAGTGEEPASAGGTRSGDRAGTAEDTHDIVDEDAPVVSGDSVAAESIDVSDADQDAPVVPGDSVAAEPTDGPAADDEVVAGPAAETPVADAAPAADDEGAADVDVVVTSAAAEAPAADAAADVVEVAPVPVTEGEPVVTGQPEESSTDGETGR